MVMAMAMVLGLSLTTFATGATLTVTNAEKATFKKLQVIVADPTTATGWAFTSETAAAAYVSAFSSEVEVGEMPVAMSDQEAIAMLIKAGKADAKLNSELADVEPATAAQIGKALSNVWALLSAEFKDMENGEEVTSAGIYVIKGEEEGYTYNNMAIYVGFGPVDGGNYPTLTSEPIAAKKSPNTITKENVGDAEDNAVAIGDVVEFKVTSNFPFIDPNAEEAFYVISDTLTGATFNMATVKVTIGGVDRTSDVQMLMTPNFTDSETLEINFNGLIDVANSLASQEVVVTYSATVTEVSVNNTVSHTGTGIEGSVPGETNIYTGSITMTKYAEDGTTTLEGAEFVVARPAVGRVDDDIDNIQVNDGYEYATFDSDNKLTGWVNDIDNATPVKTGVDGKVTVNGLDENNYAFIEVKAPEGYSINEEPSVAKLEVKEADGVATDIFTADTSMVDTTLNSLPSTGGIGTTIFTIGGVAIMVVAAGLFFATRKKASK